MGRQSRRVNKRTTMKTLLFVAAFLAMALAAPQDNYYSNCKCSDITVLDSRSGLHAGNCIHPDPSGRYYCYVSSTSDCPDKVASSRAPGLYASYTACDLLSPYTAGFAYRGLPQNRSEGLCG